MENMTTSEYELVVRMRGDIEKTVTITVSELADRCECSIELVRRFMWSGLIDPIGELSDVPLFGLSAVPRLKRALRLKRDFKLNVDALALVVELLDRIEELEKRQTRG
jgi:chaperone modulatory protein CbpM